MLQTALGLVLLVAPLFAAPLFGGRGRGLLNVAAHAALWHLTLALVTQAAGVFSYPVVVGANAAAVAVLLAVAWRRGALAAPRWHLGLLPTVTLTLPVAFLLSVHFLYAGPVDTAIGPAAVPVSAYPYPFYSDEWVAVVLANHSIETGGLPTVNPLDGGSPFVNFLAGFHSTVTGLLVLLGLIPLTGYVWLAIGNGVALCALVFLIARQLGVSSFAAAFAAASLPFVTNAGNLPGIWYLLPYTLSLSALLLSFSATLARAWPAAAAAALFGLVVYPPSIVFAVALAAGFLVGRRMRMSRRLVLSLSALAALAAAAVLFVVGGVEGVGPAVSRALDFAVRRRLDLGTVSYLPWHVLPLFLLPLAVAGLFEAFRRRVWSLAVPLAALAATWAAYGWSPSVVLVEPSRVVTAAAVLATVAAALGIDAARAFASRRLGFSPDPSMARGLWIVALVFLVAFGALFSRLGLWHKNVLVIPRPEGGDSRFVPAPPVTRYLTKDDLRLFEGTRGERFLGPAWKGLVIAAATGAIPLDSKPSTISHRRLSLPIFFARECSARADLMRRYEIDLVYAPPFSCDGFVAVGESAEGLALYRFSSP